MLSQEGWRVSFLYKSAQDSAATRREGDGAQAICADVADGGS
jgi:hypothetical protein